MDVKRAIFNNKVNSLLQEFHFASPEVLVKSVSSYATSFVGSQVWNLFSEKAEKIYNSWNVFIRQAYGLDRQTHRHLIEPLSQVPHLKTQLCSRFINFMNKLLKSGKFSCRFLANLLCDDQRTVFGNNISKIAKLCNYEMSDLSAIIVKK